MVVLVYKAENRDTPWTATMMHNDIHTESCTLYGAHTKEEKSLHTTHNIATWKQECFGGLGYSTIYQPLCFVVRPDRARICYYQSHIVSTSYTPGGERLANNLSASSLPC